MLLTITTAHQPGSVRAQDLTVPQCQLSDGCQLTPAASVDEGSGRVRGGLWGGLPSSSNPWSGAERVLAGKVRLRVEGGPRVADGPPSRADLVRQELKCGEDVEEAYAAFYTWPGDAFISVCDQVESIKGQHPGHIRPHGLDDGRAIPRGSRRSGRCVSRRGCRAQLGRNGAELFGVVLTACGLVCWFGWKW